MVKHGKKYQEAIKLLDKTKLYSPQEAVELAKKFGSDSSSKFVNGVLGAVSAKIKNKNP